MPDSAAESQKRNLSKIRPHSLVIENLSVKAISALRAKIRSRRSHHLTTSQAGRGQNRAYARRSRRASILRFQLSSGVSSSRKT
jgi:hypothetical protein